ncbi:MAG: hypothetical protein DLD55_06350 [candidate division SR1 bacterium]|nr:MAG: hypothetical protein DLD55_06350 [candidate division SR1 bacterium]
MILYAYLYVNENGKVGKKGGGGRTTCFLEEYKESMLGILSFSDSKFKEIINRDNYEVEMFARLAYEFESLEPIEQKEFKEEVKNLLKKPRYHETSKEVRTDFLEDRKQLFPETFAYQEQSFQKYYCPKKSSLQAFYDTYLKDI